MTAQNPFVNARIQLGKEYFIGREEEIRNYYAVNIEESIFKPDLPSNLAIIGIPGIGKGSLAQNAILAEKKELTKKKIVPIWIHVASYNNSQNFLGSLVSNCASEMEKLGWLTESLQNSAEDIEEAVQSEQDIQEKIKGFFATVKNAEYGTLFILNRFDHAGTIFEGDMTFQLLNQLGNGDDYSLSWVLTSHQSIEKVEDQAGSISPFSKLFPFPIRLAMFNNEDLNTYFSKFSNVGISISNYDRERILFYCGGHPYLLQVLGYQIVSRYHKTHNIDVDSTASDNEECFFQYYQTLTDFLRKLKLLEPLLQILFDFSNYVKQNYKNELKELEKYGLIKEIETDRYVAYSEHFHNSLNESFKSSPSPPIASTTPKGHSYTTNNVGDLTHPISFKFVEGECVPFRESLHWEFKEIKKDNRRPDTTITNTADEYAVAFLNKQGGRVFWGINDQGFIVGVKLDRTEEDSIREKVPNKLSRIISRIDTGMGMKCTLEFHQVYESDGGNTIDDLFIVELAVPRPREKDNVFYTESNELYVKTVGGKKLLTGTAAGEFYKDKTDNPQEHL